MKLTQAARLLGHNLGQPVPESVLEALIVSGVLEDMIEAGRERIAAADRAKLRLSMGLEREHPAKFTVMYARPFKPLQSGWTVESHESRAGAAALTVHIPQPPPPDAVKRRADSNVSITEYLGHLSVLGYEPLGQLAAEDIAKSFPKAWEGVNVLFPATLYKKGTIVGVPAIATASQKGRNAAPSLSIITIDRNQLPRSTTRIACVKRA